MPMVIKGENDATVFARSGRSTSLAGWEGVFGGGPRERRFKNAVANKGLEVVDDGDVGVRGVWPRVRFSGA